MNSLEIIEYNEKALILAYELLETGNKTQVWIAKDVIKELENVTKTEGRKRLISTNSKMGQNYKFSQNYLLGTSLLIFFLQT